MAEIIYKEESYNIIGAAMEVHKTLGNGFLEAVYQESLAREFTLQNLPFQQEKLMRIYYKDVQLSRYYKADFVCFHSIIVEIKALSSLTTDHEAQILNYLKVTEKPLGILINFGTKSLEYKRILNNLPTAKKKD